MTDTPLIVLRALQRGYKVEVLGELYAYDPDTHKIGTMGKGGGETFLAYCDGLELNTFLAMCAQVPADYVMQIQAALAFEESAGEKGGTQ